MGNALLTRVAVDDGFAVGLPLGGDDDAVEPEGSGGDLAGVTFAEAPYGTREPRCAIGGRVAGPWAISRSSTLTSPTPGPSSDGRRPTSWRESPTGWTRRSW